MITADSVIDALGGTKAVASALALAPSSISVWRVRGIPSTRWLDLVRLADARGLDEITLESLARLAAREKDEARA